MKTDRLQKLLYVFAIPLEESQIFNDRAQIDAVITKTPVLRPAISTSLRNWRY